MSSPGGGRLPARDSARPARWWLALLGFPIGFASSLCGIGGGLFASSLLHFALGFELRRATATGLVLVFATTSAATLSELLREQPSLDPALLTILVLGVWIGARGGFVLSERLPESKLRAIFSVVLLFSSWRLAFSTGSGGVFTENTLGPMNLFQAFWLGVGGGVVAPLLGVGGGLIMVPGLYLLVGVSFDVARATSLAAGVFGSGRSLRLKAQVGRVAWRHGVLLGAGSLCGSALGVAALDRVEELREFGRIGLAGLLAFLGLRFAREVWRSLDRP